MDKATEQRLDALVEDEVRRGFVIVPTPPTLERILASEGLPALGRVRFTRLNGARRRKIAEVVQRQYHRDLQNADILSNEQLRKLAKERGEWTEAKEARLAELVDVTQREMRELYLDGLESDNWMAQVLDHAEAFRAAVRAEDAYDTAVQDAILERFDRWVEYAPDRRAWYTEQYAAEQDRPQYSPDLDLDRLLEAAPSGAASEALLQIDELRDKLYRLMRLRKDQMELLDLREQQARVFADSCESRRDATENLARLFFCCERVGEDDVPLGPLTSTFDQLWELPDEVTTWLLEEQFFFVRGTPKEARDMLSAFGFLTAERKKDEETSPAGASAPSVESPVPPSSKADSTPATATVVDSLASVLVTT